MGEGLTISPSDIGERLWRIFTSMRTALILMLILSVLALVGTLFVQAPAGMSGDTAGLPGLARLHHAEVRRLDGPVQHAGRLQRLHVVLGPLGFLFKFVLVLLTTSILACSVNRAKGLWKTAVHPRTRMTPVFFDRAPHSETIDATVGIDAAVADVTKTFKSHHFRTVVEREGDEISVYADRFRWAPFGTLMAHISLVMILVGALVGGVWGFRDSEFAVPVAPRSPSGTGRASR